MHDKYTDLTPAQRRVIDAMTRARAPIAVAGDRRYSLEDAALHYATVEALERRGVLKRAGGYLVIAVDSPLAPDSPPTATGRDTAPAEDADTPPTATGSAAVLETDRTDRDGTAPTATRTEHPLEVARRHAVVRAAEDADRDDVATRARASLRRQHTDRDLSLFGWLWRRLEGLLS